MRRLLACPALSAIRNGQVCYQTIRLTRARPYSIQRKHDPLRILFCGADEFSIYSLKALCKLQLDEPSKIETVDVLCRPDKTVGRGLKHVHSVPIKSVATDRGLVLHQVDSFRDWTVPAYVNLIVAVSFGLLVPGRVLEAAKYGGLNVHPSLLPDLRGAAPIQHALLRRYTHTGVSLQTMHPSKFDRGLVIDQTPAPGIDIPEASTVESMVHLLGPLGANMLSEGIQSGLFLSPVQPVVPQSARNASYATKITPQERELDWQNLTAEDIILHDRVLGNLWDRATFTRCSSRTADVVAKRVTFEGPWSKENHTERLAAGQPMLLGSQHSPKIGFGTIDGMVVSPSSVTIEGDPRNKGLTKLWMNLKQKKSPG